MKTTALSAFAMAISVLAGCATDGASESAPPAARPAPEAPRAPTAEAPRPAAPKPVDSTIAWKQSKEQALAEAQSLASKAQSMKVPVTVNLARAQKRDEAFNKTEQMNVVKNVVLRPLASDKIAKNDKIWAEVVRQVGKHAAQANVHEPQQIVVSVTKPTRARVTQWLNEGIASANNGQKPDLQVFEKPLAKDTAIFYMPLDQKQFTN